MLRFTKQCRDPIQVRWETFTWKRLHHTMANLIRIICIKLYQIWPRFVKGMTKTFRCVFRFTVPTAVHLQFNANANNFTGQCKDIIRLKWKKFTFLYDRFTQDNIQQILSKSVRFYRGYDKKYFGVFFRFTVQISVQEKMISGFGNNR